MRCIAFTIFLSFVYFINGNEYRHPNLLFKMHLQLAKAANRTNCWVCSKPPPSHYTPAMAAVHAIYDVRIGMKKYEKLAKTTRRHLSIEFDDTFLQGNISYSFNVSSGACSLLDKPIWVSGQLGSPQMCFNLKFGTESNFIGTTTCETGITVNLTNETPKLFNDTNRPDYICWKEGCDVQTKGAIPQSIMLLLSARDRQENSSCAVLTGPYYFLCGSAAYKVIPRNARGSCVLVKLVPASYIAADREDLLLRRRARMQARNRRELFSSHDQVWAWFPAWTGWGIELMKRLNNFSSIVDEMFNETIAAMREITEEQKQMKTLVLQEKMALDYLLASKGGFCEFIGEDCCTWIADTSDKVQAHMDKVTVLQGRARSIANEGWNPFTALGGFGDILFSIGNWLKEVGVYILMLFLFLFILYILVRCSCCLIDRITQARADDHILIATPGYTTNQPMSLMERMSN